MPFPLLTVVMLFALSGSLMLTPSIAAAGPKEDVADATLNWGQT